MTVYVNDSGTWREIEQHYVYDSTWRTVYNQYVNHLGTWRTVFPNIVGSIFSAGNSPTNYAGLGLSQFGTQNLTPATLLTGEWRDIGSTSNNFAAIKTDGNLWTAVSSNTAAQLGRIVPNIVSTPITTFAGGTNWVDTPTTNSEDLYTIDAGWYFGGAIKTDGTLWMWGNNPFGELGSNNINDPTYYYFPTPITTFSGGTNWKQLSCGGKNSDIIGYGFCTGAIKTDGTLWMWGNNFCGRLGNNSQTTLGLFNNNRSFPITTFAGGTDWKQVSVGKLHVVSVKTDGTLWGWGNAASGRLGNAPPLSSNHLTPITTFIGGTNWKQVSAGNASSAAIKTDGTLWTWGYGLRGMLGNADVINRSTPVTTFIGGTDWRQVSCGYNHMAAIKTDGTLWTWGNSSNGKLGTNLTYVDTGVTLIASSTTQLTGTTSFNALFNTGKRITTSSGSGTVTSIASSILGAASLTASTSVISGNQDDGFWILSLPFNISFNGTTYSTIYVGTNSYITFGSGSNLYNSLSASNPNVPKIMISSSDNSAQRIYYGTEGSSPNRTYRVRFEGTNGRTGSLGFPNMVWEAVFYENTPNQIDIQNGENGRLSLTSVDVSTPVTTFIGGTDWKQVSCNRYGTVSVKTDGTLWAWGNVPGRNSIAYVIPTPYVAGSDWSQVSNGQLHTIALKQDGTLWTWGNTEKGSLGVGSQYVSEVPAPIDESTGVIKWKQLSGGGAFNAAIKTDGTLWTWGNTTLATTSLGVNDFNSRSTPVTTFAGGTDWKQVSCGYRFTTAIKIDGTLWTWGNNQFGELGTGDNLNRSIPTTTFVGGTNWRQVSAGSNHTAAVKTDGTLWTWGNNSHKQLGTGNSSSTLITQPTVVPQGGWKKVYCSSNKVYAIRNDDTLYVLGRNGANNYTSTPITTFAGGTNWADTPTGAPEELYTIFCNRGPSTVNLSGSNSERNRVGAIKTDGTLWMWGKNFQGVIGNNLTVDPLTPVTTFIGGTDWKQVTGGLYFTAAIKTDGTLWTWGNGNRGRLGNGNGSSTGVYTSTPITTFTGGTNWKQVSSGDTSSAAIKTDGTLWVWGDVTSNFLAKNLNKIPRQLPASSNFTSAISIPSTTILGGTNWKQVSVGEYHMAAVTTGGVLYTAGQGELGLGRYDSFDSLEFRSTPVTTFAGGSNWSIGPSPERKNGFSIGFRHSAAIKQDGTLWLWGQSRYGELGNGTDTGGIISTAPLTAPTPVTTFAGGSNWVRVLCSSRSTAAIKTDGTLWTWGVATTLGIVTPSGIRSTPVTTFVGGTDWRSLFETQDNQLGAIKTDGSIWNIGTIPTESTSLGKNWITFIASQWGTSYIGNNINGFYAINFAGIKTDGTLWLWGDQLDGQLGNNVRSGTFINTPVTTFTGGTNWNSVAFACSRDYASYLTSTSHRSMRMTVAATKTDGTLWSWGANTGNIIRGTVSQNDWIATPVTVISTGAPNWQYVHGNTSSPNEFFNLNDTTIDRAAIFSAIKNDGTLWMWGATNSDYQLATTSTGLPSSIIPATTFAGGTNWANVYVGGKLNRSVMAVKSDGTLWVWGKADPPGRNNPVGSGLAILNYVNPTPTFMPIPGSNWASVEVSSGSNHLTAIASMHGSMAAIKTDGTLWVWGENVYSSLGTNDSVNKSTPVTTFVGGTNWKQVSLSRHHAAAIKTDGTLWVWGNNLNGCIGLQRGITYSIPQNYGGNWKQVVCGGSTNYGQFTLALRSDNQLFVLGGVSASADWTAGAVIGAASVVPELGINGSVDPCVAQFDGTWEEVSSNNADDCTLAIKTDGTLWGWGNNASRQLGTTTPSNVVSRPILISSETSWSKPFSASSRSFILKKNQV